MRLRLLFLFLIPLFRIHTAVATTWDEPWHDQVVKAADHFVLATVTAADERKGFTASIIRTLDGSPLSGQIQVTNFYLLDLCSTSGGHGPEFPFQPADTCYLFLKNGDAGAFSMATPTTGFAMLARDTVIATYRHSYHQAQVPRTLYEPTMSAIFNHYHGRSYDADYINQFITNALAQPPAQLNAADLPTFFRQHVALETIYHLGLSQYYANVLPFLHDNQNFHAQISAARALTPVNTPEAKQQLLALLRDGKTKGFPKTVAVWTLASYKPRELKTELSKLAQKASTEKSGFGGNIMDPRVCTTVPTVQAALHKLLEQL